MKEINSRIDSLSPAKRAILEQRLRDRQGSNGRIPARSLPPQANPEATHKNGHAASQDVPLSSAQRRLWFIDQVTPGNPAYNRPTHFRLTGDLQVEALAQSLNAIVQRHRVLRMTFRAVAGEPVGSISPALSIPLPVVDLLGLDPAAQAAQVRQLAEHAGAQPFDLSCGPLLRAQLLRLGAQAHILLVNIHHIVFDGWSVDVFQQSLAHFYRAFVTGQSAALPALPLQYDDFSHWQQQRLASAELAPQLDYWKSQLQGELPVLSLPTSLSVGPGQMSGSGAEGRSYVHALPADLSDRLKAFSQREGVTLFMTLLAAFQTLLYRYTQQSDVIVGTPVAGRDRIELEPLIGVFINTLALRTSFESQPTFRQLLQQVQQTTLAAYAHQTLPFEKLVEEIQPERQAGQTPLFQTLLQLRNLPNERLVVSGLEIETFKLDRTFVDLDLSVDIVERSDGLVCTFLYRSELFDEGTISRMAGHFQTLLESAVARPTTAVSELPLLTSAEHHQLLTQWHGVQVPYPKKPIEKPCVHRLFEVQVAKTPDAIALAYESQTLTYRELNDQANQLGQYLQQQGIGPDQPVGLCVARSPHMLVGLLAILKAGGAYVPIDPSYPQSRIDFILADAQVSALLTSKDIAARLSPDSAPTVVCVDDDVWAQASEPRVRNAAGNCVSDVQPRNLAYVIYTSGSTGQPKGVMVEHRSVVNLAIALERELPAEGSQGPLRVSLNGSLAFDTSVKQIVQLLSGHRLEIVPDVLRFDGEALLGFLQQRRVDRFDCTPSQLQLLIAAGLLNCADAPAQILVGGEPIGRELWARLAGAEHSQFYNLYGPTECTGDATLCRIFPAEKPGTIGKALANVQLYNFDAQRRPVPMGVPGELYIGGSGLARGYLNRPALTAESFVEHSFAHSLGDRTQSLSSIRLYKTGDRVRFLPDGRVEFIGRIDNQVKIRGYRIELGEIEAAMVQHPLVSAAVVVLREDETAQKEKRLVGYVASDAALTGHELYQSLKGKLPSYMVPSAFVVLEKLPLTANGKVDRRSLPAPDPSQRVLNTDFVAPRNDIEQRLAEIWAELLPAERIGIYDNFFELGGHSLLATRVIARIRTAFAVEIPVVALFEQSTIAQLGAHIEALRLSGDGQGNGEQIVARCDRNQPIPASSTQQRWWFFEQLETDSSLYNRPRLFKLRQGLPLTVVQAALNTIIRRHEVIRTTLELVSGELQQKVHETWSLPLPVVTLEVSQVGKEKVVKDYIEQAVQQPFNLSQDLMLRGTFLSLHSNSHNNGHDGERYLLLVMHHAISDHWTLDLLLSELTAICEGQLVGRSPQLPDLPIQYADFAYWQQQQFQRSDFQDHLAYWQQQLSGEPPILDLPLDHTKTKDTSSHVGEIQQLTLSPYLLSRLKALGQQNNATLFMTLLAAFKVLLYRYTQQTDIIVGIPVAGRQLEDCENLLGCFLNTLAFRSDLAGEPTFESLLQRVRTVSLEAYAHQHCPFEKVIEQLQVERDFSQSPLFNVVFDYINTPPSAVAGSQTLPLTPVKVERRVALFDLTLYLEETANGFEILFEYSPACFEAATISRLKGHFQTLLESIVAAPSTKIDRLAMLTGAERQQLLFEWNQTQTDYPRHQCVHELFEEQVVCQPGAIALTQDQQQITYQQLNQRANQLACYLQSCGVEPGSLVGLYLERSPEMVAAMLAILKAGAAYVTLDPEYPAERLAFMLQDTQISILLSQTALSQNSPFRSEITLVNIEGIFEQGCSFLDSFSQENLTVGTKPEDLAYVIYTSGSTGKPKGVTIPHLAVNRLVCKTNYIDIQASDRVAQISNAAFDAAPFEIWSALLNGAQLVLIDKAVLLSPEAFSAQLREYQVSSLLLTTALFNQVASVRPETFSGLRYLLFGGEAADPKWVRAVLEKGKPQTLIHAYGPAENTTISTCYEVTAVGDADTTVPIGAPIANTQVYILDGQREPVPMGVVGELYMGGDGLAQGYLNRPKLTAERFVPHPFSAEPVARLYKTGDLARYRAKGEIEFIGRQDHQVKIRGFRIELGEIGTVLAQHPQVGDALMIVQDLPEGEKRLVAYVTAVAASLSSRELRRYLQARLPNYMVPAAFVVLERFPLTPNGKVDRRALPAPAQGSSVDKADFVAPSTVIEKQLAQIWGELLQVESVGLQDSFFELGGHSLLATRLVSQIRAVLAVEIPLRAVFESPTLGELSEVVQEAITHSPTSADLSNAQKTIIPTISREEPLPLSFAQQRLWFLSQLEEKQQSTTYNITGTLQLEGPLRISALEQAIVEIVQRHESLRTVFPLADSEPVQCILPAADVSLPRVDLRSLTEAEHLEQIERLVDEVACTPFDLSGNSPLLSFRLVQLGAQNHALIVSMHHIVSDGWSVDIFKRELSALYHDFAQGKPASLPALPVQYADFAHWQRQQLQGDRLTEQLTYWQQQLAGAPKLLEFPTDHSRPPVQDFAGAAISFQLDRDLSQKLTQLAASTSTTLYMTLLAAFSALLYRYSHAEDIVVGSPIANRTRREIEPLIGFFANTLPMRTRLGEDPSFFSLLEQVKRVTLEAYAHQDLPFEKLVEVLNPERTLSYHPIFQVVFSLQNEGRSQLTTPSLTIRDWESTHTKIAVGDRAKFDLGLSMVETAGGLVGTWRYATALFDSETIHRLQAAFHTLLSSIVEQPDTAVSMLPILSEAERQLLLSDWIDTAADYPRNVAVHQLFEQQAALTPNAIAVQFKDQSLTYTALNQRANQLAHHLKTLNILPGDLVGLFMERSPDMIVSMLAILKVGGAYVPLDTSYPLERITFILQDTNVSVLLTQCALAAQVTEVVSQVVAVDGLALDEAECANCDNLSHISLREGEPAEQLAYVMYTSGSTGTPKGVCVRHRSISRLVKNTNFVSITPEDVFLQLAPVAFDAATFSIWGALLNGASVVLFPHAKPSPETIAETVSRHQVTIFFVTAGLFHVMVDYGLEGLESTRQLLFGGDVVSVSHLRKARAQLADCTFINGYGPTENTTFTTYYPVPHTAPLEQSIPIGYPIANTRTYVLDRHCQPVPIGVYGELYAGGDGVAAGYLHRPELTQERFIQNPLSQDSKDVLYKTGDLVRYRADGSIEFAGRLDHQVKVRGFRIELGEIETALERHPQVEKTVVTVWEKQPGDKRLIVYFTCQGKAPSSGELSRFLKQSLPSYMVPAAFVVLETLPLTPNGKVDRRSLPQPDRFVREVETALVEPQTQLQTQLATIWQELLSLDAVGIYDNFFELGGHSLLATQVISRVRGSMSVALTVRSLFEEPTIAGLADLIEAGLAGTDSYSDNETLELEQIEPVSRDLPLPLSFAQQRLWFLSQLEETGATYNVPAVLDLRGPLNVSVLEQVIHTIAQRHEVLRTTFQVVEGQPTQVIGETLTLTMPKTDLRSHPSKQQKVTVSQLSNQLAHTPFDLSKDCPLRAQLIQLGCESHVLILVLHHIVADGWSMSIFLRELSLLYREEAEGVVAPLVPLPIQYADFAYWQRQWLQGEVRSRQLSYWQQQLAGAPTRLVLPVDYNYPEVRSPQGATLTFQLSPSLTRQLNSLAKETETTLFMTLLSAFSIFLYRYSQQGQPATDIVVGTPIANRNREEIEPLIGFFANTLLMRTKIENNPRFVEVLQQVRQCALEAYAHQDLPFEQLVEVLRPARTLSHNPLFQVMFALQTAGQSVSSLQNDSQENRLSIRKREIEWNAAKFDLNLSMTETDAGLKGRWNYSTDLFKPEIASLMVSQFQALLESIVAAPERPVDELSLLSAQAQQTLAQSQQKSAQLAAKIATLSPAKRSLLEQKLLEQKIGSQQNGHRPARTVLQNGTRESAPSVTEAPLSFAQQNLWLLDQLNPGNPAFNRPTPIRLTGQLDISALEASLAQLVHRHEVLRTHFQLSAAGEPVQIISQSLPAKISLAETLEDLSHLPAQAQEQVLKQRAIAQANTLFDLTTPPLFTVRLLRLSATEYILLCTFHHIIFDGWSTSILLQDLAALYRAAATDQPAGLPSLAIQYAEFARRQQRSLRTQAMATQLAYWKKQLSGQLPILELPTDRPRRSATTTQGAEYVFDLPQSLKAQLSVFAQREHATLFMVLLAGFKTLLYRYTQADDVIVGSPIAGRNTVETEKLIGLFFNTLILRTGPTGAQSFQAYVQQVRQTALDAYAHQDIPLPKLVEALHIERDLSRSTLFQVLFQFKNLPNETVSVQGSRGELSFSDRRLETDIASLELALEISEQAEGLSCLVKYDAALFDAATIHRLGEHFQTLLESAVENPRQSLDALSLLPSAEQQKIAEWSLAETTLPTRQVELGCIHRLFESQVLRRPDAIAVTYQQQHLTYQALNRRANQLVHRLRKLGVGPNVPVGIYLARSPDLLIALLAVLKAGGAYVPLDAEALPTERVAYVLQDTQAPVLITHSELRAALPTADAAQICLDTDWPEVAGESDQNLSDIAAPGDLAYIIYTSGSTGQPKGTMVEHHSLVDAFWSWEQAYQLPQLGSHLQMAGFSFDVFTADWVRSLCSGAQLVLCPADYRLAPEQLYHLMHTAQIACAEFVPGVIRLLMQYLVETGQSLDFMQLLIVGSDTWYMREYRQLQAVCGAHTRLVNSYGLTEDTVDSTFFETARAVVSNSSSPESLESPLAEDALVPIGRPFANTQLHILDSQLRPVPIGIPGELYISGSGLARGYLNRAELTAQRFIEPAGYPRLYKTGDRARYLNDGNVEFLGRLDFQVKLRGFRIELGEIEAALARSPEVQQCVVVLQAESAGQDRLVAYWTPVDPSHRAVTPNELKQRLKQSLPDYMVPVAFVALDTFPLTPSGKINRKALPAPDPTERTSDAAFVAPRTPAEKQLAQLWCELLNLSEVSIHDDFFDLGGHSLLAVHLVTRIRDTFNRQIPLSSLFQDKSIAQLVTRLADGEQAALQNGSARNGVSQNGFQNGALLSVNTPLVKIRPGNLHHRPIFFVHPIGGSVFCYRALADQLATDRPFYGFQAPAIASGPRYQRLEEMAADYIQAMRQVQPQGPYRLGGWSMGGVIAYDMAQQLTAQGEQVLPLVLIDSRVPSETGNPVAVDRPGKRLMVLFARDLGCTVAQAQQIGQVLEGLGAETSVEQVIAPLHAALQQFGLLPPTLSQSELQHLLQLFIHHLNMLKAYVPRPYAGSVALFRGQTPVPSVSTADEPSDRSRFSIKAFGWQQLVQGDLMIHTVPGSHYSMMRSPNVATLADRLSQLLMQHTAALPIGATTAESTAKPLHR